MHLSKSLWSTTVMFLQCGVTVSYHVQIW